jgi:hypothetical protein
MTRDPLLPVRLVDGVWTTGGVGPGAAEPYPPPFIKTVSIPACQSTDATERQPGIMASMTWPTPAPKAIGAVDCSPSLSSAEPRFWAAITDKQRTVFAAVALDGSGVWAIGDSAEEARTFAGERRLLAREDAQALDLDFPPPETDAAWLATLAIVTLSGTTESLRALIKSMETGDPVAPWCPHDLWDNPEPTKEPPCSEMT